MCKKSINNCQMCDKQTTTKYCSQECYWDSLQKGELHNRKCLVCSSAFYATPSQIKKTEAKFCSRKCYGKHRKSNKPKNNRECLYCDKPFYAEPNVVKKGNGRYCSRPCFFKHSKIITAKKSIIPNQECAVCNKEFYIAAYVLKNGYGKYCSMKCSGIARKKKPKKAQIPNTICEGCGKDFFVYPYRIGNVRYCSNKCHWHRESNRTCLSCDKDFYAPPNKVKKGYGKYCSAECRPYRHPRSIPVDTSAATILYWIDIEGARKIGITTQTIKERWRRRTHHVIKKWVLPWELAISIEDYIINHPDLQTQRYSPLALRGNGSTECFSPDTPTKKVARIVGKEIISYLTTI